MNTIAYFWTASLALYNAKQSIFYTRVASMHGQIAIVGGLEYNFQYLCKMSECLFS